MLVLETDHKASEIDIRALQGQLSYNSIREDKLASVYVLSVIDLLFYARGGK